MAYVIERESHSGPRYTGMHKAVDGNYKVRRHVRLAGGNAVNFGSAGQRSG
jgi:hypothetical protein